MRLTALAIVIALPLVALADAKPSAKALIVHEWGTFTSLQDESGKSIGGVNVDDEPVPSFVHRFGPANSTSNNGALGKGYPAGDPAVTMRLETPVMYFYPPSDMPVLLDVQATFNGGLLTEFYPNAVTSYDDHESTNPPAAINANTRGGLHWQNVVVAPVHRNSRAAIDMRPPPEAPVTDSRVWLAPREVKSTPVTVARETEQYLFYRGVGHVDAPVSVARTVDGKFLTLRDNRAVDKPLPPMKLAGIWLADFRADGNCAFRAITDAPSIGSTDAKPQPAMFSDADYASENVDKLRDAMGKALRASGLFEDEAKAMLETWKLSYFKSNGQRLFFIVPRDWTDTVLPLKFSQKCDITRVMMGRIEVVTPTQRAALDRLTDRKHPASPSERKQLMPLLGRFADALIENQRQRAQLEAAAE